MNRPDPLDPRPKPWEIDPAQYVVTVHRRRPNGRYKQVSRYECSHLVASHPIQYGLYDSSGQRIKPLRVDLLMDVERGQT